MPPAFSAEIVPVPSDGAYVVVPFTAREAFGTARAPVVATFDGHPYRGSLMTRNGISMMVVRKDVQAAIGKGPGDTVEVAIERDTAPREVEVPAALADALDTAGLRERFDAMAYTHRKEYAAWIEEAKKPETRARRAAQAAGMIAAGQHRS